MEKLKEHFSPTIRGALWLSIGQISLKISKILMIAIVVRFIGLSDYGIISIVMAFLSLFFIPSSLLHVLSPMVRDLSSGTSDKEEILKNNLAWRTLLGFFAVILGILGSIFYSYHFLIFLFLGLSLLSDFLRDFFTSLLESNMQMDKEGKVFIFQAVGTLIFGIGFMVVRPSAIAFALSYFISSLSAFLLAFFYARKVFSNLSPVKFSLPRISFLKQFLGEGLSFGLFWSLANNFMFQFSLVFLAIANNEKTVAIFSIVFQIVQAFALPYIMFSNSSLPRISRSLNLEELQKKVQAFFLFCLDTTLPALSLFSLLFIGLIPFLFPGNSSVIRDYFFKYGLAPMLLLPVLTALVYSLLILGLFKKENKKLILLNIILSVSIISSIYFFGGFTLAFTLPLAYLIIIWFTIVKIAEHLKTSLLPEALARKRTQIIFLMLFLILYFSGQYVEAIALPLLLVLTHWRYYLNLLKNHGT